MKKSLSNLTKRYNRLSIWNRVAFWGSLASIAGIFLWFISFIKPDSKNTPEVDIDVGDFANSIIISDSYVNLEVNQQDNNPDFIEKLFEEDQQLIKLIEDLQQVDRLNSETLFGKYNLGYAILTSQEDVEDKKVSLKRLHKIIDIDWSACRIFELSRDKITVKAPNIIHKDSSSALLNTDNVTAKAKVVIRKGIVLSRIVGNVTNIYARTMHKF
ncbi:MAG: hypothetical protein JW804_05855 [Sedimentisphaerales bacterium]|nr:hypothetical protein [Sedimentisphaerales bacterium]